MNWFFNNENDKLVIPINTKKIIDELNKKYIVLLHPYNSTTHLAFIPSKNFILNIINMFSNLKIENYNDFQKWF